MQINPSTNNNQLKKINNQSTNNNQLMMEILKKVFADIILNVNNKIKEEILWGTTLVEGDYVILKNEILLFGKVLWRNKDSSFAVQCETERNCRWSELINMKDVYALNLLVDPEKYKKDDNGIAVMFDNGAVTCNAGYIFAKLKSHNINFAFYDHKTPVNIKSESFFMNEYIHEQMKKGIYLFYNYFIFYNNL